MKLKTLALAAAFACSAPAVHAQAAQGISDGTVKIGLILDMSGLYSDITGAGLVSAVKMAVEDFGGKVNGKPIEVLAADHLNKADVAAAKAREWFDVEKVDAILDVAASAPALAVASVAKEKNRIAFFTSPGSARLSNEGCTPVTIHYTYDTYALAQVTGGAVVKNGGDSWFFITADYAFGHSLEKETSDVIKASGGKVLGSARHPLATADFSSYILKAQSSGAKVVGLANAGGDTINTVKAAREFGLTTTGKQQVAALLMFLNDVHSLGLDTTQGMLLSAGWYWNLNEETRAWSRRYFERMKKMPNMTQAGAYSATLHYLNAVKTTGTDDTDTVMKKLKDTPINDMFTKNGRIREDGRMVHDMYLFQVKKPSESKTPWDYYTLKATVPGDKAFTPPSASACPLINKK